MSLIPINVLADGPTNKEIGFFSNYTENITNNENLENSNIIINDNNINPDDVQYINANLCVYSKALTNIYSSDELNMETFVIGQLSPGDFIQVIGEDVNGASDFYKVIYNQLEGYVSKSDVTTERIFKVSTRKVTVIKETNLYKDDKLSIPAGKLEAGKKVDLSLESADIFTIVKGNETLYFAASATDGANIKPLVQQPVAQPTQSMVAPIINGEATENIANDANNLKPEETVVLPSSEELTVFDLLEANDEIVQVDTDFTDDIDNVELVEALQDPKTVEYVEVQDVIQETRKQAPKIGGGQIDGISGKTIVDEALKYVGYPYVHGGSSLTKGTDCSGFTSLIYAKFGYKLPRYSGDQRYVGRGITLAEAKPGDIICYPGHVAIYLGNNRIVHASTPKNGIITGSVYTGKRIVAVRRILPY